MIKKLLKIEKSNLQDFSLGIRYIVKTYKFFGIPIYKKVIRWP